ncbi:hypothetical protein J2X54_000194 [Duganella sp. 3397]|uniref:hypothetical protein n=1 Tax=Duganella sp. 3397 TaxID=2817732 RepID=UPI002859B6A0|nr:hypothetical protein [Duganella sp. 3397]MDR7047759.1 hypothetical protein [Duganella sp. 3397]
MSNPDAEEIELFRCHACKFDLRYASSSDPLVLDEQSYEKILATNDHLGGTNISMLKDGWNLGHYSVLHQLCKIMSTKNSHASLKTHVLGNLNLEEIPLLGNYTSFEVRPIEQRHYLAQLAAWLLLDLPARLKNAWHAGAVRYNILLKDFEYPPEFYTKITGGLSDWRDRAR